MSVNGISGLERGYRRTPQFETVTLLAGALALSEEQRRQFFAVARSGTAHGGSVTVGPWPSAASASLPLALTRFIGRTAELDEIISLVNEHRLTTLTGAGGIGKTQTALRAATAVSIAAETGLCFVGLAPISDPSLVETAIATALGVQEAPNHPLLETLVTFLKNKTTLLVLDNCEHLIGGAAIVADSLLRDCPNLRVLATSREPLLAAGERIYRLSSLDQSDAVVLFADRARAANAHFTLTNENRPVVGEICARIDGIPLAIELAAARVAVAPLRALAKSLEDRGHVPAGGARSAPPRQQTMGGTIDWSYELLSPPEQRLFERLSIFAGGCTIDAATAVCQGEDIAADDVLMLIESLVGKSLVEVDLEGDEARYRLLEPFREHASEKLKAAGEKAAVARRHALAYLEDATHFPRDQQHTIYYEFARNEIGNWRAAVQWALTEGNHVLAGQRLVAEVVYRWGATAVVLSDARRWIPAALELIDERTPRDAIAKLRLAEAELALNLDTHQLQLASGREAAVYYRAAGDELNLMRAQMIVGNALFDLGQTDEARAVLEEALSIARKLCLRAETTRALRNLGACLDVCDVMASRRYLTEALHLIEAADDQYDMELIAIDLAALFSAEGNPESALRHLIDVFARGRELATPRRTAVRAQIDIAKYLIALGRYEEARKCSREALEAAHDENLDVLVALALGNIAAASAFNTTNDAPDVRAAATGILGFVGARLRALGSSNDIDLETAFAVLRGALGAEAFAKVKADGAAMTEDQALEVATRL